MVVVAPGEGLAAAQHYEKRGSVTSVRRMRMLPRQRGPAVRRSQAIQPRRLYRMLMNFCSLTFLLFACVSRQPLSGQRFLPSSPAANRHRRFRRRCYRPGPCWQLSGNCRSRRECRRHRLSGGCSSPTVWFSPVLILHHSLESSISTGSMLSRANPMPQLPIGAVSPAQALIAARNDATCVVAADIDLPKPRERVVEKAGA